MPNYLRKLFAVALALAVCVMGAQPCFAGGGPAQSEIAAAVSEPGTGGLALNVKSAILMEQRTGQVLYESNADEPMPPASITKVMTLLLVMEALDEGKLTLDQMVSCSDHAASMGGSQIWLEAGESMSVQDLLKATAVSSANDAAVLLAEAVAGSEEAFVAQMNERARQLGMTNTTFQNACGLDETGHQTTARDIAVMSRALMQHEAIREYTTIWMDTLRDGKTQLVNTNKLVRFYDGATGLKTGTTNGAGSCLTATATRGSLSLVAVVLGAPTSDDRFNGARTLLDYGFANFAMANAPDISSQLAPVKVLRGVQPQVGVSCQEPNPIVVRLGEEDRLTQRISLAPDVQAPVEEGQVLGKAEILLDGVTLAEYNLTAAQAVGRMTFGAGLRILFSALIRS